MKLIKNKNNTNFIICNLIASVANRITNYHMRDVILRLKNLITCRML